MLQVQPDWNRLFKSKEEIEQEITSIKFKGPGWYLWNVDSVLILPEPPWKTKDSGEEIPPYRATIWHQTQPEGTMWRIFVWNRNISETIFGADHYPPTRQDERE